VDFQLSEDQQALKEGVRNFCDGRVSADQLRELEKEAFDRALWGELAEMGVFGLRLAESEGGVGLGSADAVVVFEELGRCLAPGPLVWTHLLAGRVEGAASGECVVGGLDLLGEGGGPVLVEHLAHIDTLVTLREEGVYRVAAADLEGSPIATPLDPFTPLHHVARLPDGERIADGATATQLRVEGAALASALMLGIAERTQELATEYAKGREQFNRPIGSFQAIKHILADMFVRQELARAAVYAAGATLDDPEVGSVTRAVSTAKLVAGEAAMKNSRSCVQVHGGMGYTWEMPVHYYLKRTWVLENVFGGVEEHALHVADAIGERA